MRLQLTCPILGPTFTFLDSLFFLLSALSLFLISATLQRCRGFVNGDLDSFNGGLSSLDDIVFVEIAGLVELVHGGVGFVEEGLEGELYGQPSDD
ncbi:hypothetical protein ACFX13_034564 [Malus domestica]